MARSALAGEEDVPPGGSAMDVSFEAAAPSVDTQKTSRKQHHADDMPCTDGGDIGYLGWPARKLLVACHRIFLKGLRTDGDQSVVAESLGHRGVIFWSLSNMDADTEDRCVRAQTHCIALGGFAVRFLKCKTLILNVDQSVACEMVVHSRVKHVCIY